MTSHLIRTYAVCHSVFGFWLQQTWPEVTLELKGEKIMHQSFVSIAHTHPRGRVGNGQANVVVLRFYGPVNPMGSCGAQSVYLTTCLLGRLSPLSG